MASGLPYDSDAARGLCGAMTALLHGAANLTSAELAAAVGPFDGLRGESRADAARDADAPRRGRRDRRGLPGVSQAGGPRRCGTKCSTSGRRHGFRNAQATVLAPTGTISFLMDCDTTGIEPDIALVKYKQLGRRRHAEDRQPDGAAGAARRWATTSRRSSRSWPTSIARTRSKARADLQDEHLPVFDCAFQPRNGTRSIAWQAHVRMMAAAQPFLSGRHLARRSTCRARPRRPTSPTPISKAGGWVSRRWPSIATARRKASRCRPAPKADKAAAKQTAVPRRERLPDTRQVDHAQVQRRRPRGLHHRRPVRRRPAGRAVHHHGQGREHRSAA